MSMYTETPGGRRWCWAESPGAYRPQMCGGGWKPEGRSQVQGVESAGKGQEAEGGGSEPGNPSSVRRLEKDGSTQGWGLSGKVKCRFKRWERSCGRKEFYRGCLGPFSLEPGFEEGNLGKVWSDASPCPLLSDPCRTPGPKRDVLPGTAAWAASPTLTAVISRTPHICQAFSSPPWSLCRLLPPT